MDFRKELEAFEADHPFKEMAVGNLTFHYMLCGWEDSPCTLVYFVGGTGNPAAWYRHVLSMESKYQVLLLDYPMREDRMKPLTDRIGELLDMLHIEKAVFIGASFGGYIAQLMAKYYPQKTRALVLYATTSLTEKGIEDLKKQYRYVGFLLWLIEHIPYNLLKALMMKPMFRRMIPRDHSEQSEYLKRFVQWVYDQYNKDTDLHLTRLMADIVNLMPVTLQDYAYLQGNILLILPENDKAFTEEMQSELVELMQGAEVQTMPGDHLATICQADEFAERTDAFLKEIRL